MDFEFTATIAATPQQTLVLIRDRLPELAEYLPAIETISEISREEEAPGRIHCSRQWQGNPKLLPAFARPFATRAMLSWKDHALWLSDELCVHWRFEPARFQKLFKCSGSNYIEPGDDGGTNFRVTGSLVIDPNNVPGVPRILARKMVPRLERWAVGRIRPNLLAVPNGVNAFLAAEREKG